MSKEYWNNMTPKKLMTKNYRLSIIVISLLLFIKAILVIGIMTYYNSNLYYNKMELKVLATIPIPKPAEPKIMEKEIIRYIEKQDGVHTWKLIQNLNGRLNEKTAKIIAQAVDNANKKYGIPKKLIISIAKKESDLDPLARSRNNKKEIIARGLMQVYAKWHPKKMEGITLEQLYHIDVNIDIGCQIFREYYDESNQDLTETFHKYLSKKASKSDAKKYMNEILKWWAKLEMYEYDEHSNEINQHYPQM